MSEQEYIEVVESVYIDHNVLGLMSVLWFCNRVIIDLCVGSAGCISSTCVHLIVLVHCDKTSTPFWCGTMNKV